MTQVNDERTALNQNSPACWVVVPAAGASRRMGAATPKQYLPLLGRAVIEWSLAPFLGRPEYTLIVVVLALDDCWWDRLPVAAHEQLTRVVGGVQRVHSVLAGLNALKARARADDWVLVHDAARPCLSDGDLARLVSTLAADEVGGLLAAPLVDTLKRADDAERVLETVPRERLWRALTPQMFRYGVLQQALTLAVKQNLPVTDEAQAIEALGYRPRLIAGDADNLKITRPADLARAARILCDQQAGAFALARTHD